MIKVRIPKNSDIYITGKNVYQLYLMLKNHMNGKYDVIKYNWVMRVSDVAYNKRRDKYFFEKLAEKYKLKELVFIFVSNLVANQNAWIGDISDVDALIFYREYIGKLNRLSDTYKEDIQNIYYFSKKVDKSLTEIFEYNNKINSSYIFKLLQSNIISYETFILIDSFLGIIDRHDNVSTDLVWSTYSTKLNAYKKLLDINSNEAKERFKTIIQACKL